MAEKFESGYPASSLGARAGPNTPEWWSDTGPSWNPETGLDIYGNYGGPIGTSGPMGSGSIGKAQDAAYMQYKNSLAGQIPAVGLPEAAPVAGLANQMPEVGLNIMFGGQVAPQQQFQNAPQSIGMGLFGGQFQNLMMQQPPFYNPLMGYGGIQNFGGLFGQQQNAMNQYRGSGYLMPPPQQPQQQFSPQTPAFFDSLAYRPL